MDTKVFDIPKAYMSSLTANNIKVRLVANALGIKIDYHEIKLHQGEQFSDKFRAINSEAKTPAIVDGLHTLSESNAILYYLANKHQSSLWPEELDTQSQVIKILLSQSELCHAAGVLAHRRIVLPQWGNHSAAVSEDLIEAFHDELLKLESLLEKQLFVACDSLTIADLCIASFFVFYKESNMPIDNYITTLDWLARLEDLSWFSKTKSELASILGKG